MQIFHWHFKHQPKRDHNNIHNKEEKGKDIVLFEERRQDKRRERRKLRELTFLCRKLDVATACFYSTLNLKKIDKHWNNIYSMKMMKKQDVVDNNCKLETNHAGNKVLPVTDNISTTTTTTSMDKLKGDNKIKAMSRMKDLLRWAAAAKSKNNSKSNFLGRKVLQLRNKAAIKAVKDENEEEISSSNESPKISFRWEVESNSCSSVCSSMASSQLLSFNSSPRKGNWITTDSEFVVLEL